MCSFRFLLFFVLHAPSPVRHAFGWWIVGTRITLSFIGRFRRGVQRCFRNGLHFQTRYIVLTFFARWRHKFRIVFMHNCEKSKSRRKSLCTPLRTDSWGFWKQLYCIGFGPGLHMCTTQLLRSRRFGIWTSGKRCVLDTKVLRNSNMKPWTNCFMLSLSTTLSDLLRRIQDHDIFWSLMSLKKNLKRRVWKSHMLLHTGKL